MYLQMNHTDQKNKRQGCFDIFAEKSEIKLLKFIKNKN